MSYGYSRANLTPVPVREGHPRTFGWLRRSEMDTKTADVWEHPDGRLFALRRGVVPRIAMRGSRITSPSS